jgi:hypothetical protein
VTVHIHTIDDLLTASPKEIEEAKQSLQIRKRITETMTRWGKEEGYTLEEYKKAVIDAEKLRLCPHCHGTGKVRGKRPRTVGCIHPSSAAECRLRLYYDVTGEFPTSQEIKPALQITFQIGHVLHDFLQRALADSVEFYNREYQRSESFDPEARVNMGLVQGNTDGDICFETADAILEIKTDGPSSFPKRRGPDPKHEIQAGGLYATGLNKPFIVYLYVEKVWPHSIKEYVKPYDARIFRKWWKGKGAHVERALATGTPPIADAKPSECTNCPYGAVCTQNTSRRGGNAFTRSGRKR